MTDGPPRDVQAPSRRASRRVVGGLLLASASLALLGCAAGPDDAARATVVLSVSHDLADDTGTSAYFFLDERILGVRGLLGTPVRGQAGDFRDGRGQVYLLRLLPGVHTIDRWRLETQVNVRMARNPPPPLSFSVAAGETVYIGNLHVSLRVEPGLFDAPVIRGALPVVRDRAREDLEVAESRHPGIGRQATVRLLPLGPWIAR